MGGLLKIVNATVKLLAHIVHKAELQLGSWHGAVDLSVAPMDDFKLVLGLDFLRKANAIPMPSFGLVCILEKESSYMVHTISLETEAREISVMQLNEG